MTFINHPPTQADVADFIATHHDLCVAKRVAKRMRRAVVPSNGVGRFNADLLDRVIRLGS